MAAIAPPPLSPKVIRDAESRTYTLRNTLTGLCLGYPINGYANPPGVLHHAVTNPKFYATALPCNSAAAYTIWVNPLTNGTASNSTASTFRLKYGSFAAPGNQTLPDMCLDVKNSATTENSPIIIYPCGPNPTANQVWLFTQ